MDDDKDRYICYLIFLPNFTISIYGNKISEWLNICLVLGVFAFFAFFFVIIAFAADTYEIVNQPMWDRSFRKYIRFDWMEFGIIKK